VTQISNLEINHSTLLFYGRDAKSARQQQITARHDQNHGKSHAR